VKKVQIKMFGDTRINWLKNTLLSINEVELVSSYRFSNYSCHLYSL